MSAPTEQIKPLIYISRMTNAERGALYAVAEAFSLSQVRDTFRACQIDVVLDRLKLATGLRDVANRLLKNAVTEYDYRTIVNRAYYSIHHSTRAITLKKNEYESDSHEQAIEALEKIVAEAGAKCGLDDGIVAAISEARNNREVADYSPYDWNRGKKSDKWIPITNDNWAAAAKFNVELATRVLLVAERFVGVG